MLKITITKQTGTGVEYLIEGSLIGPWVDELRRLTEAALQEGKQVSLDLLRLRFVDRMGAALLRELAARRVSQLNCSAFVRQNLEEAITCATPRK